MHRRDPLGVNDDVLRGHGLAGEDKLLRARGVGVPALEDIAFLAHGRGGSDLAVQILEALLIFFVERFLYLAVLKGELVLVAVVVEFGVFVLCTNLRTYTCIEGIAGDGVPVLFSDFAGTNTGAGILVVLFVVFAANEGSAAFAGEHLYIVISSFTAISGLGTIEIGTAERHRLDVDLSGRAVLLYFPSAAAVNGRPLVADVSIVFGSDG